MTLQEKIQTLTHEQLQKIKNVKDNDELSALLSETGLDLTDEELETVTGSGKKWWALYPTLPTK